MSAATASPGVATAAPQTFEIRPFSGAVGAEIIGLDLTRPINDQDFARIHRAHLDHHVVVFRDQQITPQQQIDFSRRFGVLQIHVLKQFLLADHPEILIVSNIIENGQNIGLGDAGKFWHSDLSYKALPSLGSMLHAQELPEEGGDTLFANMYAAYEALSDRMKAYLDGLTALHDGEQTYRGLYANYGVADKREYPRAEHPVVRTHPVTGKKSLYVNRGFTRFIVGIPRDESDAMLAYLYQHAENPLFQCRFRWTENAIAFWDNRCAQHRAMWDYWPHTRSGTRVTVKGERPV